MAFEPVCWRFAAYFFCKCFLRKHRSPGRTTPRENWSFFARTGKLLIRINGGRGDLCLIRCHRRRLVQRRPILIAHLAFPFVFLCFPATRVIWGIRRWNAERPLNFAGRALPEMRKDGVHLMRNVGESAFNKTNFEKVKEQRHEKSFNDAVIILSYCERTTSLC